MTAAETAACVSLQKPSAFWALHGAIFEKQDVITPASIGEVSGAMAGQTGGIDKSALDSCVDSGQGRTIVQTDMRLGASVGIRATPTAFINGIRVEGVPSDVQVQTMIRESSGAPSTGP